MLPAHRLRKPRDARSAALSRGWRAPVVRTPRPRRSSLHGTCATFVCGTNLAIWNPPTSLSTKLHDTHSIATLLPESLKLPGAAGRHGDACFHRNYPAGLCRSGAAAGGLPFSRDVNAAVTCGVDREGCALIRCDPVLATFLIAGVVRTSRLSISRKRQPGRERRCLFHRPTHWWTACHRCLSGAGDCDGCRPSHDLKSRR